MLDWLRERTTGQRVTFGIGVVVGLLAALDVIVLQPAYLARERAARALESRQATLGHLRSVQTQAAALRAPANGGVRFESGVSLLDTLNETIVGHALQHGLSQIAPDGDDGALVGFRNVAFEDLVDWLGQLDASHGVAAHRISVDRAPGEGLVNARIVFLTR